MVLHVGVSPLVAPDQDGYDVQSSFHEPNKFPPTPLTTTALNAETSFGTQSFSSSSACDLQSSYPSIFAFTTLSDPPTSPFDIFSANGAGTPFDLQSGSTIPGRMSSLSPPLSSASENEAARGTRGIIDERAVEMASAAAWFALHQIQQQQQQSQRGFQLQPLPEMTASASSTDVSAIYSPLALTGFGMQDTDFFNTPNFFDNASDTPNNRSNSTTTANSTRSSTRRRRLTLNARRRSMTEQLGCSSPTGSLSDQEPEYTPTSASARRIAAERKARRNPRLGDTRRPDRCITAAPSLALAPPLGKTNPGQQQQQISTANLSRGAVIVSVNRAEPSSQIDGDDDKTHQPLSILRATASTTISISTSAGDDTGPYRSLLATAQSTLGRWDQARLLWCLSQLRPTLLASRARLSPSDHALKELALRRTVADIEAMVRESGTPTAVWRGDAGGTLVLCGDELCELLGRERRSLLGDTLVTDLMDATSIIEYWERFVDVVCAGNGNQGAEQWSGRCTLLRADGLPVPCAFWCTVKRDLFGDPAVVIGNFLPVGR